jgi:phosphoribosylamine--glycine ligase
MLTEHGQVPKILEYNARFGDPETQTYMRLLETDLLDVVDACIDGTLAELEIKWKRDTFACTLVLASAGYPEKYEKGKVISGILEAEKHSNVKVFHAGTRMVDSNLVTNGGRVLGVTATGDTLEGALSVAYEAVGQIHFEGMQFRKDIGKKALSNSKDSTENET